MIHSSFRPNFLFVLFLADRAGLQQKDVLEVFTLTTMASPYMIQKAEGTYNMLFFMICLQFYMISNVCVL